MTVSRILSARRVSSLAIPKPTSAWSVTGLRYERNAHKALASSSDCLVLHNPQFAYTTGGRSPDAPEKTNYCIPDFILAGLSFLSPAALVVIECKLTYRPDTAEKLTKLYVPVVARATGASEVWPTIVVKNLTAGAPEPFFSLEAAICRSLRQVPRPAANAIVPVVQWLGRGAFPISA